MRVTAKIWSHPLLRAGLALGGLGLCAVLVTRVALQERHDPERCPEGMVALGARCCGAGQKLVDGACSGRALGCSIAQALNENAECVARFGVVSFDGGDLFIGAQDWDGASGAERFPRTHVTPFQLDVSEVTRQRYGAKTGEPGQPMSNVTVAEADAFCRQEHGRLPTAAEWVWAAAGSAARRYAWGNSGLVCRRTAFGLVHGPCADGAGAELSGSRPDGASPEGLMDLAGNVAEWTKEPNGDYSARGGSFRSTSAAELKSWASISDREKALHIGFRCAYPP